jgi:hypothetical protein
MVGNYSDVRCGDTSHAADKTVELGFWGEEVGLLVELGFWGDSSSGTEPEHTRAFAQHVTSIVVLDT